jgi:ubiquinone/menaquinone biosynthesis C-methylase UbiE
MSRPTFATDGVSRFEALYRTPDVAAQRAATLAKLRLDEGDSVIDVGSGPGFLAESMADIVGPSGRVLGIDISAQLVQRSVQRNQRAWLSYRLGDAVRIDEPDASFDALACTQVAEFVPDVDRALAEAFRVLKRGGRSVFVATDWDGVLWHTDEPARMAAVMKAWEPHCAHPRLPRTLADRLRAAGFVVDDVTVFPIVNLCWSDDSYSKGMTPIIAEFVAKRGGIESGELEAWAAEFARLSEEGRYFFCTSRFIFSASKPAR